MTRSTIDLDQALVVEIPGTAHEPKVLAFDADGGSVAITWTKTERAKHVAVAILALVEKEQPTLLKRLRGRIRGR